MNSDRLLYAVFNVNPLYVGDAASGLAELRQHGVGHYTAVSC